MGLFAVAAATPAWSGLEGGVPGQGATVREPTAEEVTTACEKITIALDKIPGFTVIAKGHPAFPELQDLKIGAALKASCNIDDATWNKPPSHQWETKDHDGLYTREDLMAHVADAVVFMTMKVIEPAYKKLFRGDPVVSAALDQLNQFRSEHAVEIDPRRPASPRQLRIPRAKDAGVQPATPEQITAICKRIATGISLNEGMTFLFKSYEKVDDYRPDDLLKTFEQSCGDIVTVAAKNAPPLKITKERLIAAHDDACKKLKNILLNPMKPDDRAGLYAILDKDDYTRQTFDYVCNGGKKPSTEETPQEPTDDQGPALQAQFTGGKNESVLAI
jgi:hypothetical protein